MDWIMNHAVHKGYLDLTVGEETCMDLDYVYAVSLLGSMLEILVLLWDTAWRHFTNWISLKVCCIKTKLQAFADTSTPPSKVSVLDHDVEVVRRRAASLNGRKCQIREVPADPEPTHLYWTGSCICEFATDRRTSRLHLILTEGLLACTFRGSGCLY